MHTARLDKDKEGSACSDTYRPDEKVYLGNWIMNEWITLSKISPVLNGRDTGNFASCVPKTNNNNNNNKMFSCMSVCTRYKQRVVVVDLQTKVPGGTRSTYRQPSIGRIVKSLRANTHTHTHLLSLSVMHGHFEVRAEESSSQIAQMIICERQHAGAFSSVPRKQREPLFWR